MSAGKFRAWIPSGNRRDPAHRVGAPMSDVTERAAEVLAQWNAAGWTAEHDPGCDGSCSGCPVQVQWGPKKTAGRGAVDACAPRPMARKRPEKTAPEKSYRMRACGMHSGPR